MPRPRAVLALAAAIARRGLLPRALCRAAGKPLSPPTLTRSATEPPSGARLPARGERQAPRDLHLLRSTDHLRHGDTAPGSSPALRGDDLRAEPARNLCLCVRTFSLRLNFPVFPLGFPCQVQARKGAAAAGGNRVHLPRAWLECHSPSHASSPGVGGHAASSTRPPPREHVVSLHVACGCRVAFSLHLELVSLHVACGVYA